MCGIIGLTTDHFTPKHYSALMRVLAESSIRGRHASGAVFTLNGEWHSIIQPAPIDTLELPLLSQLTQPAGVNLIAHARYSTSDLAYNQPIYYPDQHAAISHNGVITQAPYSQWKRLYRYKTRTKNDSELLLQCILHGDNPYTTFPDSSIAALLLTSEGITPMRNGLRPLWRATKWLGGGDAGATFYASTADILERAGLQPEQLKAAGNDKQLLNLIRQPIKLRGG